MAIYKSKLKSGTFSWYYQFSVGPRGSARIYKQAGFASKKEAIAAEAARRWEVAAGPAAAPPDPKSLGVVIAEWLADCGLKFSPKTTRRYRELVAYLAPELAAKPIGEITALTLHHEWARLTREGGHFRRKDVQQHGRKTSESIARSSRHGDDDAAGLHSAGESPGSTTGRASECTSPTGTNRAAGREPENRKDSGTAQARKWDEFQRQSVEDHPKQ